MFINVSFNIYFLIFLFLITSQYFIHSNFIKSNVYKNKIYPILAPTSILVEVIILFLITPSYLQNGLITLVVICLVIIFIISSKIKSIDFNLNRKGVSKDYKKELQKKKKCLKGLCMIILLLSTSLFLCKSYIFFNKPVKEIVFTLSSITEHSSSSKFSIDTYTIITEDNYTFYNCYGTINFSAYKTGDILKMKYKEMNNEYEIINLEKLK